MKVAELIALLTTLPPDMDVVTFDNEWSDYEDVTGAHTRELVTLTNKHTTIEEEQQKEFYEEFYKGKAGWDEIGKERTVVLLED
jgi:hypothetical protein